MDCDYQGLVDLVVELTNGYKMFIPLWILVGMIIGVLFKDFVDDLKRNE